MSSTVLTRRAFLTVFRQPAADTPPTPAIATPMSTAVPAAADTPVASVSESPLRLPPLQQTILDVATVEALFRDLAACTSVHTVRPKYAPGAHAPAETLTLEQARVRLFAGLLLGVQIRYAFDGHTWTDTLLRRPNGLTLVRIREADIAASVARDHVPASEPAAS